MRLEGELRSSISEKEHTKETEKTLLQTIAVLTNLQKENKKDNIANHEKEVNYVCPECGETFPDIVQVETHSENVHNNAPDQSTGHEECTHTRGRKEEYKEQYFQPRREKICRFYRNDNCKFGAESCRFSHKLPPQCRYGGNCRRKTTCRFTHSEKFKQNNNQYPNNRYCKWGQNCRRRFCQFSHAGPMQNTNQEFSHSQQSFHVQHRQEQPRQFHPGPPHQIPKRAQAQPQQTSYNQQHQQPRQPTAQQWVNNGQEINGSQPLAGGGWNESLLYGSYEPVPVPVSHSNSSPFLYPAQIPSCHQIMN